ncbi:MAG: OPT family oligopeptide transporter [Anaeromyxobacteraceae bacterium]
MTQPETAAPPAPPEGLPENAFRELAPGETYQPAVPATAAPPEVTLRSIAQGVLWSVVFSAAATYIALKLGQGIESAIPISILAVGLSAVIARTMARRASTMLENVNVLAIGATSGIVAGGSVFTMPAVFILGLEGRSSPWQIFLVPLLGAVLGVFLLAPFRRYFTHDLHGKLPFPEGRATTEILVAGNKGGESATVLAWSAGLAAVFDFVGPSMRAWSDTFSTAAIGALQGFTDKVKAVFTMNTTAAIFGLGYIMGVDYAAIILAGSFLSYFVLIPLFAWLGPHIATVIPPGTELISKMDAAALFTTYARPIGIGGIFAAGIISILKMSPVIVQAVRLAVGEVARLAKGGIVTSSERTDRSLNMSSVLLGILGTGVVVFLYFRFSVLAGEERATSLALLSTGLTLGVSFLFAAVSAWAIAMISITPISGMTLTTLIITAVVLSSLGLKGESGMLQTLLIGGVVCTALSMSGSLVTQYKIGYWLGATPRRIRARQPRGLGHRLRRDDRGHLPHGEGVRLRPRVGDARPAAERHGGRAHRRDGLGRRALVPLRHRRGVRGRRRALRRLRPRARARHVPADGPQLAARGRRRRGVAREALLEGREGRRRAPRARHAHRVRLHRRRRARRRLRGPPQVPRGQDRARPHAGPHEARRRCRGRRPRPDARGLGQLDRPPRVRGALRVRVRRVEAGGEGPGRLRRRGWPSPPPGSWA